MQGQAMVRVAGGMRFSRGAAETRRDVPRRSLPTARHFVSERWSMPPLAVTNPDVPATTGFDLKAVRPECH